MPPPDTDTASTAEVQRLIRRLARLEDNWPSERTLAHLSPRMLNGLLIYNNSAERGLPLLRLIFALGCASILWLCTQVPVLPLLATIGLFPLMLVWLNCCDPSMERCSAAYALTQIDDVRVLPILIKATDRTWGHHAQVIAAIRRLLPLVTEEHVGLLRDDVQMKLWHLAVVGVTLFTEDEEALARGTVQALAHVGNRKMLSTMQYYASASFIYLMQRPVREAMEQYLPTMEARLQRQEVPATLLRASDVSTSAPDTLLRAANAATAEPTAQLLRAATSETPSVKE